MQACVDQLSGEAPMAEFGDWWGARGVASFAAVQGDDHTIVALNEAARQVWIDALEPMAEDFIADMEARGIDVARAICDAMKAPAAP